jgi:4-hydroxy-2-oxoheptanedioate aldolase
MAPGQDGARAIATIPSVQTVQVMASSGLDFVIIGMEYGAVDARIAHNMSHQ